MQTIRTALIDDEPDSIEQLQLLLAAYPQVLVVATFTNPRIAVEQLELLAVDLVFLDIEMPQMNGFDLLSHLGHLRFKVVFATAYHEFALKAFRFSALDYIVKPFDQLQLGEVIAKASHKHSVDENQLTLLRQQLRQGHISKIAIPQLNQVIFIDIKDIVYAEASGNYTEIVLQDKKRHLVTRKLKELQQVLEEQYFLRIHRQYIINLNMVKSFNRNEGMLTLVSGDSFPVARSQKDRLIESYGWL